MRLGTIGRLLLIAILLVCSSGPKRQVGAADVGIHIVADSIGGVVTSAKGPEAGVWVITETRDLPTRYAKIVVTDDQGRFLVPGLPKAKYEVWVRGYGLVDSEHRQASPGQRLNLTATLAPDAKAAAQYYPAAYWYALLQPPAESQFPGTGDQGNGIAKGIVHGGDKTGHWNAGIVLSVAV